MASQPPRCLGIQFAAGTPRQRVHIRVATAVARGLEAITTRRLERSRPARSTFLYTLRRLRGEIARSGSLSVGIVAGFAARMACRRSPTLASSGSAPREPRSRSVRASGHASPSCEARCSESARLSQAAVRNWLLDGAWYMPFAAEARGSGSAGRAVGALSAREGRHALVRGVRQITRGALWEPLGARARRVAVLRLGGAIKAECTDAPVFRHPACDAIRVIVATNQSVGALFDVSTEFTLFPFEAPRHAGSTHAALAGPAVIRRHTKHC